LRTRDIEFGSLPALMGIINVTPDSFSDGGRFLDPARAIEQGLRLAAEGAQILDVGGESTRPYASPVDAAEELRRVIPVISGLCDATSVPVSIDTSKAAVAAEAIAAGAEIINDVTGFDGDPAMLPVAAESQAGICAMHMRGTPQTMQDDPTYDDITREIFAYLRQRRDALMAAGIDGQRVCLDPGIGFGKTHQHNLTLLNTCVQYHALRCPLLVGASRKGFIGKVLGDQQTDRTAGTLGVCLALARAGIQVLRVHDIAPVRQALLLFQAAGGLQP
jgi:dihydropteroate synthase